MQSDTGMSVEHLLLLVDFSEGSDAAVRRATQIARDARARLTVLHAIGPEGVIPKDAFASIGGAANLRLQAQCALAEREGVAVEARIHPASAIEALEETESEIRPDLVVVGARGQSALRRVWLGSVAEAVVRQANAPTLVVRNATGAAPYRRLLHATDYSPDAEAASDLACAIADPDAAHHVVHVAEEVLNAAAVHGSLGVEQFRREARERLDRVAHAAGATPHLVEGGAAYEIPKLAAQLDCDLVAVGAIGTRSDGWLQPGGVATRVMRRSGCSVLVGRAPASLEEVQLGARDAHGAIGRAVGLATEEARALRRDLREIARMARDGRALEDELLTAAVEEIAKRGAALEAEHPALAEALSRVIRTLSRMGI